MTTKVIRNDNVSKDRDFEISVMLSETKIAGIWRCRYGGAIIYSDTNCCTVHSIIYDFRADQWTDVTEEYYAIS